MSIQLNDNLKINVGNPIDSKYLNSSNAPYGSKNDAITAVTISLRYLGLTVLIQTGNTSSENTEYWWRKGVDDTDLEEKKFESVIPENYFVTGGTNLGFFSGGTGIQTIELASGFGGYTNEFFYSEYQYFLVDNDNYLRIDVDGINDVLRRGYVNAARTYSWVYNEASGTWVIIFGDAVEKVGEPAGILLTSDYTEEAWVNGSSPSSGGTSINVYGSLNTGTTITNSSPLYAYREQNNLHFRAIKSITPEFINVDFNDNFISISGTSSIINGQNFGGGVSVFSGKTGNNLVFNTLVGSGGTSVSKVGDEIRICSDGGGDSCYNLTTPSLISVGGIDSNTVLTGKTSFELWEELLVPELCGDVEEPELEISLSASGLFEIDRNISQTVTGNFDMGSINPQYCSLSDKRSGAPIEYCFTGTGMPSGFQTCTNLSASQVNPSYDVVIGTQTWGVCTKYAAGQPALSSKGNEYCAALPLGYTLLIEDSIIGVYPLYGTTSSISTLSKQTTLRDMSTANNICMELLTETGGTKQKFEIPCAWLGAPTNRPLVGVCQYNTLSSQWEYPGGSAGTSLTLWTSSSASETVEGNSVGYCRYTYNGVDRSSVCIRLVFNI